ncbi:hypothetical protein BDW02DRAFT_570905 [Decorospora gaudefroyi]|uniref:Uncharacterized protein n=1 Tax=Decorospora gaudefroyi TaxID=184978 RepID=A0A6A5K4K1_9PLEO|nr:hypothetical protein BDW02DRAFT_570905 [Decorospora gaudefroyi]
MLSLHAKYDRTSAESRGFVVISITRHTKLQTTIRPTNTRYLKPQMMLAHPQRPSQHTAQHRISKVVVKFISNMVVPLSYLQCTSSTPRGTACTADQDRSLKLIVDDGYVVLNEQEDGGPLRWEATIASGKAVLKEMKASRSIQRLASVIKNEHTYRYRALPKY